jgi:glutamate dehydrogenase (NADP+)
VQINRGFRVEFNSALGPYKGGLRFHPSVNLSIIKFLGFEQTFKNALTGMPIGGGKGGSDFDPKGRSDAEIMRFCQSFMTELYRHIGEYTDVPAGDIGVGGRELGYLFGQYKRITNRYEAGVLTGKGVAWGGSQVRTEATGYGTVFFAQRDAQDRGETLRGQAGRRLRRRAMSRSMPSRRCTNSAARRRGVGLRRLCRRRGRHRPRTAQGRQGGAPRAAECRTPRTRGGARATSLDGSIWDVPCDVALPCATQNELEAGAKALVDNGVQLVAEGANMPCTPDAVKDLPGRQACSSRRARPPTPAESRRLRSRCSRTPAADSWVFDETEAKLDEIMRSASTPLAWTTAEEYGAPGDYVQGANLAGYLRVADAMVAQGVI